MKPKSTRRAARAARSAAKAADNIVSLPVAANAPPKYKPATGATHSVLDLRPTGYLLVTQQHACKCGNTWLHSEFFLVEALPTTSATGAHRRTVVDRPPLQPGLIVGRSDLRPKHVLCCVACVDTLAASQQGTVLPPLDPMRFAEASARATAPDPKPQQPARPRRAPVTLEDIA